EPLRPLEEQGVDARRHARRLSMPWRRRHGRHVDDGNLRQGRRPDIGCDADILRPLRRAVFVAAFSFGGSWLLYKLTDMIIPLRVSEEQEAVGLDISQHGEVMQDMTPVAAPLLARTA